MLLKAKIFCNSIFRMTLLSITIVVGIFSCKGIEKPAINGEDPLHAESPPVQEVEVSLPVTMLSIPKEITDYPVPPPPFSEGIYPCSDCHGDMETDPKRRTLTDEHAEIVLVHDEQHRWCLDCHDLKERDKLRLASGAVIDFDESYKLCGQCHGPKYRDWKAGVHGKRTGMWIGKKEFLLCAHCHNPHSPRFRLLKPDPPPERPEAIR